MKVTIKGSNTEVSLGNSDFLASGGEGSVYVKKDTAFKIYNDPAKMIPASKFAELAAITNQNVIRPKEVLCNSTGKPVGYTMRFVRDTLSLCQLFPKSFKEREGLTHAKVASLIQNMRDTVADIHKAGILVVDLNELNVLVSKDFSESFWIDVDSYQTKHFKATAIMPSVRDPLTANLDFTSLSDWYSFGILAFQLFIGIHPYKGKSSKFKSLEDRMKHHVSVFDPSVSIPKVCYPLDVIPEVYRSWFRAVFQDGKRLPPPDSMQATAVLTSILRTVVSSGNLDILEVRKLAHTIRSYHYINGSKEFFHCGGSVVTGTGTSLFTSSNNVHMGTTLTGDVPVFASLQGLDVSLWAEGKDVPLSMRAEDLSSYDNRLYVKNRGKVYEILLHCAQNMDGTNKVLASAHPLASVMENASRLFQGGVYQNMLGSCFVSLFPRSKAAYQVRIPELDTVKFLSAKFDHGVLMVLGSKKGVYSRFIFRFTEDFTSYDVREVENVTPTELNFVTMDSGVCVSLTEDENLELFSAKKGSSSVKVVEDTMLGGDMLLVRRGPKLGFIRGNSVFEMKMK